MGVCCNFKHIEKLTVCVLMWTSNQRLKQNVPQQVSISKYTEVPKNVTKVEAPITNHLKDLLSDLKYKVVQVFPM